MFLLQSPMWALLSFKLKLESYHENISFTKLLHEYDNLLSPTDNVDCPNYIQKNISEFKPNEQSPKVNLYSLVSVYIWLYILLDIPSNWKMI